MVRAIFASDMHSDFGKYQALVNHSNANDIGVMLFGGNFVDGGVPIEQGGKTRAVPAHQLFLDRSLQDVLTGDEKKSLKGASKEQAQEILGKVVESRREQVAKGFFGYVQEHELKPIKEILKAYNGRIVGVLGNHDPEFVKHSLEGIVEFVEDGVIEINGIKIAGASACYEPSAAGMSFPELYPHLGAYKPTNDEMIAKEDFKGAEGKAADVYLFHKGVTDRFSPDKANPPYTHDYNARRLVEIARAKGKDPLVLSGHFHDFDGGREKGIFQLKPGVDVYELVINDGSKQLEEIIVYKYVQEAAVQKQAA